MPGYKANTKDKQTHFKKFHEGREIVPVKLMPGNRMGGRYKDDEFSIIRDDSGRAIPYSQL
jgi:hypothetical protein